MDHRKLERLLKEMLRLQQALTDTIGELKVILESQTDLLQIKTTKARQPPISPEILIKQWLDLREQIASSEDPTVLVENFVHAKTKSELIAFLRANSFPIETKSSKREITKQLIQLVRVSQTITGGA